MNNSLFLEALKHVYRTHQVLTKLFASQVSFNVKYQLKCCNGLHVFPIGRYIFVIKLLYMRQHHLKPSFLDQR